MGLIWTALAGFVTGTLAKWIMSRDEPGGWFVTILLGIAGAFVARVLGGFLGIYPRGLISGLMASVLGAMLLLWAYRRWKKVA